MARAAAKALAAGFIHDRFIVTAWLHLLKGLSCSWRSRLSKLRYGRRNIQRLRALARGGCGSTVPLVGIFPS